MSNVNVYGWIRDGVRKAVLLGFSDAIEQIGVPTDNEELSPHLQAVLKEHKPLMLTDGAIEAKSTRGATGGRKRLGRSLNQIAGEKAA